MSCYSVYIASLPECPEEIEVRAHLTPTIQYTWTLVDRRFGTRYIGQATADAQGSITIPTDGVPFPSGLFNRYAGAFELSVKQDPLQCGNSAMTLCVDELTSAVYANVLVTFHESIGENAEAAVVGCDCGMTPPEEPENASLIFTFENTAIITITHNLGRYVQATIYDQSGNLIVGQITAINLNQIQIVLSQSLSGTVVID